MSIQNEFPMFWRLPQPPSVGTHAIMEIETVSEMEIHSILTWLLRRLN
jgi:hypothetical protein